MSQRLSSVVAAALVMAAAVAVVPVSTAQAETDDCWTYAKDTYGFHCDGWQVTIDNQSDFDVWGWEQTAAWPYDEHDQFGVYRAAGEIPSKTTGVAQGKSVITGPQDFYMVLGSNDIATDHYRVVKIQGYAAPIRHVSVSCGVVKKQRATALGASVIEDADSGCTAGTFDFRGPITVTFHNLGPTYQKPNV